MVNAIPRTTFNGITLNLDPAEAKYVFALLSVATGGFIHQQVYSAVRDALRAAGADIDALNQSTAEIVEPSGLVRVLDAEGLPY